MKLKHLHVASTTDLDVYQKNQLFKTLGGKSPDGFYIYYFNELPFHRNQNECFNHVNNLYLELFGEYRYSSYDSFRRKYNKEIKNILR